MTPTCAACLSPITNRDQFVIAGTEVVHKACVGRETVGWRNKRLLAATESRLATLERQVPEVRAEMQRINADLRRSLTDLHQVEEELLLERGRSNALRKEALALGEANASLREAQRQVSVAPIAVPISREEGLDDAGLRFSLLELDLE